MSQHPSLRSSDKGKQHRSVLKRFEKIRALKEKEKWDDKDSVFGLAKVKIVKFKVKKEKAVVEEGAEGAVPAAAKAAPAAAPAAKTAKAAGKPAEGKKEAK